MSSEMIDMPGAISFMIGNERLGDPRDLSI